MKFHNSKKVINLNNVDMKKILINFLLVKIKKRMQNTSWDINFFNKFEKAQNISLVIKEKFTRKI